jgi:hypothetical protein
MTGSFFRVISGTFALASFHAKFERRGAHHIFIRGTNSVLSELSSYLFSNNVHKPLFSPEFTNAPSVTIEDIYIYIKQIPLLFFFFIV